MRILVKKIAGLDTGADEAANNAKKAAANDARIGKCEI